MISTILLVLVVASVAVPLLVYFLAPQLIILGFMQLGMLVAGLSRKV